MCVDCTFWVLFFLNNNFHIKYQLRSNILNYISPLLKKTKTMKTKYLKFYLINRFSYLKYLLYNNLNYNKSFFLPIILNYLNIEIPDDALPIINFSFGIFLLAIIALLCFLNVVGYLSAIILLNK